MTLGILFLGLLSPIPSLAEVTFQRTYGGLGGEVAHSVQETSDGGYIIGGTTWSFGAGKADFYMVKTDAYGDTLWTRAYGGTNDEEAWSIQQIRHGGYVIAGVTWSFGGAGRRVYLVKTDPSGDSIWTRTYGPSNMYRRDFCTSVQQASDGGYIMAGWAGAFGPTDIYMIKTDRFGNSLWTRTYGDPGHDCAWSVQQSRDGGYIVAGWSEPMNGGRWDRDACLIKTESSGDTLWTRTYGGIRDDYAYSVQETRQGGYVIVGFTKSFGVSGSDVYLIRTNSWGDTVWTRTYGGSGEDIGHSVQETLDGGFIIVGRPLSFGAGHWDIYVIRTNPVGDTLWTRTYGGVSWDDGWSVQQTPDGGYIIGADTKSFGAGGADVYLIKTDENGLVEACQPVEPPQMRSQGYWRKQCKDDAQEDICAYADSVHALANVFDAFECDSICGLMKVSPPERDMCRKAGRQFMALLLNIASGRLALCNCLEDGREVGDAVAEIDSLLSTSPDFHTCVYARTLADDINNGIGIVPCDTLWSQVTPRSVEARESNRSIMVWGNKSVPAFHLCQNVPSPFCSRTRISYQIPEALHVRLSVYDVRGRLVRTLVAETQSPGSYMVEWRGDDDSGNPAPAGVYLYGLDAGPYSATRKAVLVR